MFCLNSIIYSFLLLGAGADDHELSNLKLQKLLYYAQGGYLAKNNGQPLFQELIYAWPHGPVVKEAYDQLKFFGGRSVSPDEYLEQVLQTTTPPALPEAQDGYLRTVYDEYGPYTAWYLRNLTHTEDPWLNTNHLEEITKDAMQHYFSLKMV